MSEIDPSRRVLVRLGRRKGNLGTSATWEVRYRGRLLRMDRESILAGLQAGWLTGIEPVRREDGDWGPLFGRPLYREVFEDTHEPRDHAKARAGARIVHLQRVSWGWLALAGLAFVVSLPVVTGGVVGQGALLVALVAGMAAGMQRLFGAMAERELADLKEKLVPPVLPPPAPVDWARQAADDEVDAVTRN
ncbi:MAG: hypothetical protein KC656_18670 [Myxococcales bacterium]|nr:hypothetical protein [Myxococcales bacterium]MCB9669924.1 hypothetical protein [Alphaproteobacteria bacterium]MCB9693202.1 hypothetical protein [Alphaproteobacteria bacterium]